MKNRLTGAALAIAAVLFAVPLWRRCVNEFAWDYGINWTAGYALRTGLPLYDQPGLRQIGQDLANPVLRVAFTSPFNSYIGPPTTALLYLPFTFMPFAASLWLYRLVILGMFFGSIALASASLPRQDRRTGWLWGTFALLLYDPVSLSIWIGQVDAIVTLGLAISIWAWRKERWWLAGAGAGVAALLKISPAVFIVYFLLMRRYTAALGALLTGLCLLIGAALIGDHNNLASFFAKVAPALAGGTLYSENQSLPAWLGRLTTTDTDLNDFTRTLGSVRWLAPIIAAAGVGWIWFEARDRRYPGLGLSLLVLVALLCGPIAWDHYSSWSIITIITMADHRLWAELTARQRRNIRGLLLIGGALIAAPMVYFAPGAIAAFWWLRLATGPKTIGLLLWLGAGGWLLHAAPAPAASPAFMPSEARGA
jgi:hypothetical protein